MMILKSLTNLLWISGSNVCIVLHLIWSFESRFTFPHTLWRIIHVSFKNAKCKEWISSFLLKFNGCEKDFDIHLWSSKEWRLISSTFVYDFETWFRLSPIYRRITLGLGEERLMLALVCYRDHFEHFFHGYIFWKSAKV